MSSPIVAECTTCGQLVFSPYPFVKCDDCRAATSPEKPRTLFEFPPGIFGQTAMETDDA